MWPKVKMIRSCHGTNTPNTLFLTSEADAVSGFHGLGGEVRLPRVLLLRQQVRLRQNQYCESLQQDGGQSCVPDHLHLQHRPLQHGYIRHAGGFRAANCGSAAFTPHYWLKSLI